MTAIAVSGASGFLGRHLCADLLLRRHRVVEISRDAVAAGRLAGVLQGTEVIIHLAARAHVLKETSSDPQTEFLNSNSRLTESIGRAAARAGVKRFIFLSSAGVLGASSPPGGFNDESVPRPHDWYTASKLQAEAWLNAELSGDMELAILRSPLIYGPEAKGNFLRLLCLALRGRPLPIGRFRAPRSMIGIRNVVDLIGVLATTGRVGRVTMLAADLETISVAELYSALSRYANHAPWLAPVSPALINWLLVLTGRRNDIARLNDPFVLRPSVAQLKFGWSPPHSLHDELRRTVLCEIELSRRASFTRSVE